MRFRQGVDLDPSQVEDARGSGGFGGGLPIPGVAAGGGGLGVLLLVGYLLLTLLSNGGGVSGPLSNLDNQRVGSQPPGQVVTDCRTGAVKRRFSRRVKKGHVVSQRPRAHTRHPLGARVALVVSKGKRR